MAQGRGRVDRADRGAEPGRAETAGTAGDRLRQPRRAAGPAGQGAQGHGLRQPAGLEGAGCPGCVPRKRQDARQSSVPVPRPGQPIHQHGPRAGRNRAGGGGDLQRGRSGHDADSGPAVDELHLRRQQRSCGHEEGRDRPDADGHHPAGHVDHRYCHLQAAGRVWLCPRHGHGPLAGRVRRADRGRHHALRRRTRGLGRPRLRDDEGKLGRQRLDGRSDGALRRHHADAARGGRLRRGRQHQQLQPMRGRRRQQGRGAGHRDIHQEGLPGATHSGEPRLSYDDRRTGRRTAAQGAGSAEHLRADAAAGGQRHGRALPDDGRGHQGHPRAADRLAGAMGQGPGDALCPRLPHLRRGRLQEGAQGLRRRRAGRQARRGLAVHQPPQDRRAAVLQPGAVWLVCSGVWRPRRSPDLSN